MKNVKSFALIAALLLPLTAGAAGSAPAHTSPDSYRVFVDLPTGYMFVQTPHGWKFRGQLSAERYSELPAGTYVSLLPAARIAAPIATADAASLTGTGTAGSH